MNAFFGGVATQDQAEALQRYFSGPAQVRCRFTYMDLLGSGSYGVAVRIRESFVDGRPDRDLVIKQADSAAHIPELRMEITRIQVRVEGPIIDILKYYHYLGGMEFCHMYWSPVD